MSTEAGSSAAGYRSLADQLRNWTDERITALLTLRPDLATPAPHDFGQLASRAAVRSSVARAMDGLTRGELFLLDALVVAGQTTRDDLHTILSASADYIDAALTHLIDLAIVWQSHDGLRPLSAVSDCLVGDLDTGVSGLRPRSSDPLHPAEVDRRLDGLSPAARGLLDHVLAAGGAATAGSTRRTVTAAQAKTPAEELVAARLLIPHGEQFVVPGEVGLAVRGGRTTTTPIDQPPEIATTERSARLVTNAGLGAATEFVRHTELLLEGWSRRPAPALQSGGLGVREFKAVTTRLQVAEPAAALIVETAAAADLAATRADADGRPVWAPTDAYDDWLATPIADRWRTLARAWLHSARQPALIGRRDADGKPRNALAPDLESPWAAETRGLVLGALAELPEGVGLAAGTGVPSLVTHLGWVRPRRPRGRTDQIAWTIEEAAAIGITGQGGLTSYGRALADGDDPAPSLAAVLPEPVSHVLLQADLTAVAPGPLAPEVGRSLQLLADVESGGAGTVFRFSTTSLRRALDAGWTASQLHEFLDDVSRTPVPQALHVLIDDAVRAFGRLRVGLADAFIRSDDEATLAALLHDPRARALGLRQIAPTVLISTTPPDLLLPRLRDIGQFPVVEAPDGTVQVGEALTHRARTPRSRGTSAAARAAAQIAAAVRGVRTGDQAAAARPASAVSPAGALSALRDAVERRSPVVIDFADRQGVVAQRVVEPRRVEGGHLTAYDRAADDVRDFPVHRIRSVQPIGDS